MKKAISTRLERAGASLIVAACMLAAGSAQAHISLMSHQARDTDQKYGPCGDPTTARGTQIYTYEPGETITVTVDEYIPHPGWFRIAFDEDGTDDLLPPSSIDPPEFYVNDKVLLDELDMHQSGGGVRSWQVTLPEVECNNCTLQVIQVMLDKPPYDPNDRPPFANDLYYACIDIKLEYDEDGTGGPVDAGAGEPANTDPTPTDPAVGAGDPPMNGDGTTPQPGAMDGTTGTTGAAGSGVPGTTPTMQPVAGSDTMASPVMSMPLDPVVLNQNEGSSDSGCTVLRPGTRPVDGAWIALLGFGAALVLRRRRRPRR